MEDFSTRRPVQEPSRQLRDIGDQDTQLLDPSVVAYLPPRPAASLPDIGTLPTSRLTSPPKRPTGARSVPERLHTVPPDRRFPGAEEYERAAQQLHAQAQRIEQWMWQLSEQVRRAHAHYQQLRTTSGSAATQPADQVHEQLCAGHDMAALVQKIDRARAEYIAIMKQAQRYLDTAEQLRRGSTA